MSNIIFLGPPGAGKGTQAQLLSKELGIPQISTGEILRKAMREGTKTGLEAKRYVESGALVPDDVVIAIVRERLQEPDCANGYMLDGFPRTVYQAEELGKFAKIDVAIELQLADEIIVNRLSEVNFRAVYAAGNFAVDPFAGLPRVYTSALKAYDAATTGEVYAIVGDLSGAQVNYPEGDGVVIKYDELTEAEADMVKVVGRQYVAHAVTAPGRFVNIAKPSGT